MTENQSLEGCLGESVAEEEIHKAEHKQWKGASQDGTKL